MRPLRVVVQAIYFRRVIIQIASRPRQLFGPTALQGPGWPRHKTKAARPSVPLLGILVDGRSLKKDTHGDVFVYISAAMNALLMPYWT